MCDTRSDESFDISLAHKKARSNPRSKRTICDKLSGQAAPLDPERRMARRKTQTWGESVTAEPTDRLGNLIRLSYEPMLVWRLDGSIEFWNAGAERLYGFTPFEAIGCSSHSLLQTRFPVGFAEVRSRLENDGEWSGELRHVCKDGREVLVDSRMQLLGDETVLEANRDITNASGSKRRFTKKKSNCARWRQLSTPAMTQS